MTKTITFRTDKEKLDALDAIAESQDRDRSYILNQAIDAYLELHQWQVEHFYGVSPHHQSRGPKEGGFAWA